MLRRRMLLEYCVCVCMCVCVCVCVSVVIASLGAVTAPLRYTGSFVSQNGGGEWVLQGVCQGMLQMLVNGCRVCCVSLLYAPDTGKVS